MVLEQFLLVGVVGHQAVDVGVDLERSHHAQYLKQVLLGLADLVENHDVLNEV